MVWVVLPEDKLVERYEPGKPYRLPRVGDVLTAPDLLPGFRLPVVEIFPD